MTKTKFQHNQSTNISGLTCVNKALREKQLLILYQKANGTYLGKFYVGTFIRAQQIDVRPLVRTIIGKSQGVRT